MKLIKGIKIERDIRPSTKFIKDLNKKNLKIIEIGTYKGDNAKEILEKLNVEEIILIDPYERYKEYKGDECCSDITDAETEAKNKLDKWYKEIIWLKEPSHIAYNMIPDNSYDFIYIDGNHSYNYVKRDIRLYWNKLKNGGIMAGHDIYSEEVFRAVAEFSIKNNIKTFALGCDWIMTKYG